MKKILFTLLTLTLLSTVAQAQLKPVKGDYGLGFKITGLENVAFGNFSSDAFDVPQFLLRRYFTDKIVLRVGFGIDYTDASTSFNSSMVDSVNFNNPRRIDNKLVTSTSSFSFSITPGGEYHLASSASKLDPYVGLEIPFAMMGPSTVSNDIDTTVFAVDIQRFIYEEDRLETTETAGGLSIGANLLAGFNYFFSDNFAIGAEYGLGFSFTSLGGEVINTNVGSIRFNADPTDVIEVNDKTVFDLTQKSTSLGVAATGGVNIFIFW